MQDFNINPLPYGRCMERLRQKIGGAPGWAELFRRKCHRNLCEWVDADLGVLWVPTLEV